MGEVKFAFVEDHSLLGITYWKMMIPSKLRGEILEVYEYKGYSSITGPKASKYYHFSKVTNRAGTSPEAIMLEYSELNTKSFGPFLLNMDKIEQWVSEHSKAI
jgi:hypothetical protein